MPFIGNKPSAVPLTSADIADGIITSAKIVDATITNSDVASSIITGQTAETSIAGGDSVLIYDDSASALRKMTRTNFVSGVGGTNELSFFAVNPASSQSITEFAGTKVTLTTEIFDTGNAYDAANSKFVVPSGKGGKYLFTAGLHYTTIPTEAHINIYINGNASTGSADGWLNFSGSAGATYSKIYNLSAGDYIELYTLHVSASAKSLTADQRCFLAGFRLVQ
jgi:hypothetical protein